MNLNPTRSEILGESSVLGLNLKIEEFLMKQEKGGTILEILNVSYFCSNPQAENSELPTQGRSYYGCLIFYRGKEDN